MRSLISILVISSSVSMAKPIRTAKPAKLPPVTKTTSSIPRSLNEATDTKTSTIRINSYLGMMIVRGSNLAIGTQLGFALSESLPIYLGPELNFSLGLPGTLFNVLGSAWYELKIYRSPRLLLHVGVLGGVGFAKNFATLANTVPVLFLEGAVSQEINDLVSVKGSFRPGMVGGVGAFMMNFALVFRL